MTDCDGSSQRIARLRKRMLDLEGFLLADGHGYAPEIRRTLQSMHDELDAMEAKPPGG